MTKQHDISQITNPNSATLVNYTAPYTGAAGRLLSFKLADTVSAKDFGAVADWNGTTGTDNAPAFQAAIDYLFSVGGGTLLVPQGFYLIKSALNLAGTGVVNGRNGNTPIRIVGAGMPNAFDTGSWTTYGGTWIVGQTSGWVIDATGLQYFSLEDIGLRGTGANASRGGLLSARSTIVQFAQCHTLRKVTIWIDTYPTYTSVGSIGWANNGAESCWMDGCWLIADTPHTVTFNNATDLNLASPYATIGGPTSSTMMNFRNTTFQAITGYASYLQGGCDLTFDTCIWTKWNGANTTNYGIRLLAGNSGTAHNQSIRITGQVEMFSGAIRIDDSLTWNITTDLLMPSPTNPYVSTGGVEMNGCTWKIQNMYGSTGQSTITCSSASSMNGGEIHVYAGGSVSANTNLSTNGTQILGHNYDLTNVATQLATGSSYMALGATPGATIMPNSANNATAAAAPNVPTSYLRPDGFVQLAGSFTPNGATTIAAGIPAGTIVAAHQPNREVDGIVYIAGAIGYCRVLTNGQIIFGTNVTTGQNANIDGFSYKLNN